MALMQPCLGTLLMDQSTTEPPSCPHEFTLVTGHPSEACISASRMAQGQTVMVGLRRYAWQLWQMSGWHMIKVLRE
ncbi:hypothetical protein CgunFtcFv8_015649 [Champsocephalus gunnari]|uniref:Uncharacterized protein n=1 Tax=Champsocephalus gunnari TaxID=52237 RepID=A0AAN8C760_CHAGU|nr:hypothetical protein CgunFtcFv8_015649 [Champsocephalus gunnari]